MQCPKPGNENRADILRSLADRGVLYDLIDGMFRYCDVQSVLPPLEETAIDICRPGLSEHLRRLRGRCIACGKWKASHPNLDGFADRAENPAGNVRKDASDALKAAYPPLWCNTCWSNGRWKDGP